MSPSLGRGPTPQSEVEVLRQALQDIVEVVEGHDAGIWSAPYVVGYAGAAAARGLAEADVARGLVASETIDLLRDVQALLPHCRKADAEEISRLQRRVAIMLGRV